MASCREIVNKVPCVALALEDGYCAVHGRGYRQVKAGDSEVRCDRCRRLLGEWEWYRRDGVRTQHAKSCREHADTERERLKASSDAT